MEQDQLKALYFAFCVGFFQNNYFAPKLQDHDKYITKLKRLFRTYCNKAYQVDPIQLEYMTPDLWNDWTWEALMLDEELRAT
jgi:hypothetical protein